MRFVVVTGMSGGGKSTAMKMLEDMGFYCVDNLPVVLIDKFAELVASKNKGLIMKGVMAELKGKADGKLINQVVAKLCN